MGLRRLINTAAYRLTSAATGNAGDLVVETDTGHVAFADGATPLKYRTRLAEQFGDVQTGIFIDFATKPDGDPPAFMDTGHPVTFTQTVTGSKAQISSGKLVHGTLPGTAIAYATYYQADLGGVKGRRIGARYVWPASPTIDGTLCIALWASVYNSNTGLPVPSCIAHLTITPGTTGQGTWNYYVSDGVGTGSSHFFVVKSGTFANPAFDDTTPWFTDVIVDREAGLSTCFLPDGQIVTVSAAEIAAKFAALGTTPVTFANLGAEFAMVEHFSTANGNTAVYPEIKQFWAETAATSPAHRLVTPTQLSRAIRAAGASRSRITYAPTTAFTLATTTSAASIDGTNLFLAATAGPLGVVRVSVTAYYEFTATDKLLMRVRDNLSGAVSALAVATLGVNGTQTKIPHVFELTGLAPGQNVVMTLQHQSITGGSATVKAGGPSGNPTYPPITMDAQGL